MACPRSRVPAAASSVRSPGGLTRPRRSAAGGRGAASRPPAAARPPARRRTARAARAGRAARVRARPRSAAGRRRRCAAGGRLHLPLSLTVISSESSQHTRTDAGAPPAWRSTLVSPSCTTRYAARSAPGDKGRGTPLTWSSTGKPALDTRPISASSSPSPGCGRNDAEAGPGWPAPAAARTVATAPVEDTPARGGTSAGTAPPASRASRRRAEQPEQVPQLRHGLPAGGLHGEQRVFRVRRRRRHDLARRARLDDHHRHVVRDHVVQFRRDPCPLGREGPRGRGGGLVGGSAQPRRWSRRAAGAARGCRVPQRRPGRWRRPR